MEKINVAEKNMVGVREDLGICYRCGKIFPAEKLMLIGAGYLSVCVSCYSKEDPEYEGFIY